MLIRCLVLTVCVFWSNLAAAAAADDRGVAVGASVSATNMDGRTSWSAAGSFEYRLNRVAGLEIEATAAPRLKGNLPVATIQALEASSFVAPNTIAPTIYPPPTFANQRGRAVMFTNNVRLHIPSTSDRVDPYFVAGGGVANIRQSADFTYVLFPTPVTLPPGAVIPNTLRPITQPINTSSTELALTLGGGIGVRVTSQIWIDADLRLFRLLSTDDRNLGRFGVGIRYRL
jgi:opacity protein-like surface antigen